MKKELPLGLNPVSIRQYHVFLASPGDVAEERQAVRHFFERYNRHIAQLWGVRFEVVDWENYATIGIGRPQELITNQTLERFKTSLALVVGIMAQRFGSPTGAAEELQWRRFVPHSPIIKILSETSTGWTLLELIMIEPLRSR
jgi:hypothetical protein